MASSRYMMSSAKKPFASYEFGNLMLHLARMYLNLYGPETEEPLGLAASIF